tara:strand:- start:489 stop:1103 length:615 start_codon:yes stop_codon:yes gene_type:complete
MPYLRGKLKGELKVPEIRKLVRLHNELSKIKIPPKSSRDDIIALIEKNGYKVDHTAQALVPVSRPRKKKLTLEKAEETFPKKTRAKKTEPEKPLELEDKPKGKVQQAVEKIEKAKPKAKKDFKVKVSERYNLNTKFDTKYGKSIYQVLKPYGISSVAKAKQLSPADLKKISRKIFLDKHPDKGGDPEEFAMFDEAIKMLMQTVS